MKTSDRIETEECTECDARGDVALVDVSGKYEITMMRLPEGWYVAMIDMGNGNTEPIFWCSRACCEKAAARVHR